MTEQLIYEIAGKKYILIEYPVLISDMSDAKKIIKKHGMIFQGMKDINHGGFWARAHGIMKLLLPEENFISYANSDGVNLK